jgi:DNA-binding CsgD family transcriptional regulator
VDEGLDRMSETEDPRRRPELLTVGLRAAAERASDARAHRRSADETDACERAAAWLETLRDLIARTAEQGAISRAGLGFGLIGEAEAAGIDGEPQPAAWQAAADHWRSIGQPYRIATCQYRYAQASLAAREPRAAAIAALAEANEIAGQLGAEPLRTDIETLARIARIDLADGVAPLDTVAATPAQRPFGLTERELEVLEQLVGGLSNRQIGDALFISESTAGVHVSNILGKLGVTSRVEAAAIAVRSGLAE